MAGERGGSGRRARPADHERATSWDKVSNWDSGQRLHTRDVHDRQQLDRTRIDPAQTKTRLRIVVGIATVLVLLAMVLLLVGLEWGLGQVLVILGRAKANRQPGFWQLFFTPVWWRWLLALAAALLAGGMVYLMAYRQMQAQNLMNDTSDVNQYAGDQHIALPEEIVRKFDWFPDVGAHSAVAVSSMISHVMLTNKGLNRVRVPKRAVDDVLGPDGEVVLYKGEQVYDDNDEPVMESAPLIDEGFGEDLFETSGLPGGKAGKRLRRRYDASVVPYNPDGKNLDKLGRFDTMADMINTDWELPDYEPQRPAGAYLVDTAPVNTMVLAITRAGKGQTVIEPTIDMWSREKNPQNMVINDPKGELLVKNYVRFTRRGYQVVQFNLINSMKTDIYNPLGLAAEAAREGDVVKCAMYVENIAEVFFPLDGGDDPFWANSANNAFKRVAYGLIDYYMEQERELRARAARQNMPAKILAQQIDELWGKVTLYNCYQFFVQLSAKKRKSPLTTFKERVDRGEFMNAETGEVDQHAQDLAQEQAAAEAELWNGQPEIDLLSLYFAATEQLPQNSIRTLIANANNSLKSMGGAEKTISTVYGIAITAMSFFTDPTIMRLTSGTPSQNVDMGGLSFPRRFGVRFAPEYLERERLVGTQCVWSAYGDDTFTDNLGKDFEHSDTVSPEGWARYYFLGMFPAHRAYLQLELRNATTGLLVKRFRFRFDKDYQTSLDGRVYVTDPVTGEKIVRNGVLVEMRPEARATAEGANPRWVPGHSWFKQRTLSFDGVSGKPVVTPRPSHVFTQTMVRYSERPRAVFMVTPPHLMKYAKLLLILIKQLVDLNFDKSYMTKSNQKPLFKTRFMLDELGNLQSEGHGIAGFQTMLSIGLGQEQQFTLILQTLQQLRDVYGESTDKVVQGNTSNIVFLKSTDDAMIETLEKMSGKRHVVYRDSKTVTKDVENIIEMTNVEGKVSYTMSVREEPVISYNDMAFIGERQSIVFRAGDAPVWNRNETILPMSWRLYRDTISMSGRDYTLQTIPTLSTAGDYDPRRNQPDFNAMLQHRKEQALLAAAAQEAYREAFGYTEVEITRLDPDVYSDEVMSLIDRELHHGEDTGGDDEVDEEEAYNQQQLAAAQAADDDDDDNVEVLKAAAQAAAEQNERSVKRYAMGSLSREDIDGQIEQEIVLTYCECGNRFWNDSRFRRTAAGGLTLADGTPLITRVGTDDAVLRDASHDPGSRVFAEDGAVDEALHTSWMVTGAFYAFLQSLGDWSSLAGGDFDRSMAQRLHRRNE